MIAAWSAPRSVPKPGTPAGAEPGRDERVGDRSRRVLDQQRGLHGERDAG